MAAKWRASVRAGVGGASVALSEWRSISRSKPAGDAMGGGQVVVEVVLRRTDGRGGGVKARCIIARVPAGFEDVDEVEACRAGRVAEVV